MSSYPHQAAAHKTLSLLSYALSNVDREVTFFDDLAAKYLVDLEVSPDEEERDNKLKRPIGSLQGQVLRPTTRAYIDLLIATGAEAGRNGGNLEEAMVLLWTMEKVRPFGRAGACAWWWSERDTRLSQRVKGLTAFLCAALPPLVAIRRLPLPQQLVVAQPVRPSDLGCHY